MLYYNIVKPSSLRPYHTDLGPAAGLTILRCWHRLWIWRQCSD